MGNLIRTLLIQVQKTKVSPASIFFLISVADSQMTCLCSV
jgi:hypothetical protein